MLGYVTGLGQGEKNWPITDRECVRGNRTLFRQMGNRAQERPLSRLVHLRAESSANMCLVLQENIYAFLQGVNKRAAITCSGRKHFI
jgi:hypothetical protein